MPDKSYAFITEKDAWAEGMEALDGSFNEAALCATAKRYDLCVEDSRCIYAHLWDSLYAKRGLGWDANPWVWVVEFKRLVSDAALVDGTLPLIIRERKLEQLSRPDYYLRLQNYLSKE